MITLFVYLRAWKVGSLWEFHATDWFTFLVYDVILVSVVMIAISLTWIAFGWDV